MSARKKPSSYSGDGLPHHCINKIKKKKKKQMPDNPVTVNFSILLNLLPQLRHSHVSLLSPSVHFYSLIIHEVNILAFWGNKYRFLGCWCSVITCFIYIYINCSCSIQPSGFWKLLLSLSDRKPFGNAKTSRMLYRNAKLISIFDWSYINHRRIKNKKKLTIGTGVAMW